MDCAFGAKLKRKKSELQGPVSEESAKRGGAARTTKKQQCQEEEQKSNTPNDRALTLGALREVEVQTKSTVEALEVEVSALCRRLEEDLAALKARLYQTVEVQTLSPLTIIEPEKLNNVSEQAYEEVVMLVDSGASETVIKRDTLAHVKAVETEAQRRGTQYRVANGDIIQNEGEKAFAGYT